MANRDRRKLKFADGALANGEGSGPFGFKAETPNGCAYAGNYAGRNQQQNGLVNESNFVGGVKGGSGFRTKREAEKKGAWRNGNRSGE